MEGEASRHWQPEQESEGVSKELHRRYRRAHVLVVRMGRPLTDDLLGGDSHFVA